MRAGLATSTSTGGNARLQPQAAAPRLVRVPPRRQEPGKSSPHVVMLPGRPGPASSPTLNSPALNAGTVPGSRADTRSATRSAANLEHVIARSFRSQRFQFQHIHAGGDAKTGRTAGIAHASYQGPRPKALHRGGSTQGLGLTGYQTFAWNSLPHEFIWARCSHRQHESLRCAARSRWSAARARGGLDLIASCRQGTQKKERPATGSTQQDLQLDSCSIELA